MVEIMFPEIRPSPILFEKMLSINGEKKLIMFEKIIIDQWGYFDQIQI